MVTTGTTSLPSNLSGFPPKTATTKAYSTLFSINTTLRHSNSKIPTQVSIISLIFLSLKSQIILIHSFSLPKIPSTRLLSSQTTLSQNLLIKASPISFQNSPAYFPNPKPPKKFQIHPLNFH